jgi:hypothetical protein
VGVKPYYMVYVSIKSMEPLQNSAPDLGKSAKRYAVGENDLGRSCLPMIHCQKAFATLWGVEFGTPWCHFANFATVAYNLAFHRRMAAGNMLLTVSRDFDISVEAMSSRISVLIRSDYNAETRTVIREDVGFFLRA